MVSRAAPAYEAETRCGVKCGMIASYAPILAGLRRLLWAAALFLAGAAPAAAEITVSPLRQVLTADAPVGVYRVSNPSRRIIEGRLRWIDLTATERGYQRAAPEDRAAISAAPYLTVWPAHFRLEPGASADIRVAVKSPGAIPAGEKRSHLVIETAAVRTPLRKAGGGLGVDVGLGLSTPVILRGGDGASTASITETRLLRTADGELELVTHIEPAGAFSPYGRIDVLFTETGRPQSRRRLKRIENVSGYLDAPRRRITAPLGRESLPRGTLEIVYEGTAEFEGREFARRTFQIEPPR